MHSLKNKLWLWMARTFFRLDEIQKFVAATDQRYLDARWWASIHGVDASKAQSQLEQGVRLGLLEKCFLYEWPDSPVQFVVPEEYVGRTIRLSDVGYIGEDDQRQITINPHRVRQVFVAAHSE